MHHLEVPLANAGLQVDGDEAFGEQVVARPIAAVLVDRRRFNRQIHETGFRIDGDLRPYADVARPFPRSVLPGLVAELARHRDRVEAPELLARPDVEGAHETFRVRAVAVPEAFEHRRADDDDVADDGRRGVQADLT